ncbi:MAG: ATP-binding protein [Bradymonadia bacterium]
MRLTLFATCLIGIAVIVPSVLLYQHSQTALKDETAARLKAVVTSAATFFNDAHHHISQADDGELSDEEVAEALRSLLQEVQTENQLETPLYTLRPAEDYAERSTLEWVLMSEPDETGRYYVGHTARARPHQRAALDGHPTVSEIYTSNDRQWLSAAAPIFDSEGHVVGILQADTTADAIQAQGLAQAGRMVSAGLMAILLAALLASLLARTVVRPIERLVEATRMIGKGRLDHRLPIERNDELGDLADGFNTMAAKLQIRDRQLARARDEALAASRSKEAFLANMSHEIRTPMNGIIGMAELLASGPLQAEQRDQANTVIRCAESLLAILNDVLDFSKLEAGKVGLTPEVFDPLLLVEDVADLLAPEAWKQGLMLFVHVEADVPRWVHGDPTRIRQVLTNIVANALKFTSEGHVHLRVSRIDDEWLRFEVQDTGIGIPPEKIASIFERFEQADQETSRRFGGTGLGLAICRRLIWLMHGEISVSSQEGEGSRFWFELPLPPAPTPDELTLPTTEERWIMVVHPDPNPRAALAAHCQRIGFTPIQAESAEVAAQVRARGTQLHGPPHATLMSTSLLSDAQDDWPERIVALSDEGPKSGVLGVEGGLWLHFPIRLERLRRVLGSSEAGLVEQLTMPEQSTLPVVEALSAMHVPDDSTPHMLTMLVVDDNPVNRRVVTRMLNRMGCDVLEASNGQEAIDRVLEDPEALDLVLMDCQMPEMDGFEATRQIRAALARLNVQLPILALTANAMASDRSRCLEAGMDDHLAKPVRKTQIADAIQRWCLSPENREPPMAEPEPLMGQATPGLH